MITNEEFKISNESYTNKDFLSIYPELLNIIKKISPRWDPSLSNESDPGNVLLKAMAFLADKINYNTDKNVLENFLPSVTQETSARNLFEMNGYFPKYYQSAITQVKFRYNGSNLAAGESFSFPAMDTIITDIDNNICYSLMAPVSITKAKVTTDSVLAIQGTFKTLTVGDGEIIQLSNLDDNNRVYFPEPMVAQNGVFVYNSDSFTEGETPTADSWGIVDNLNLVEPEKGRYFKFGFDSNRGLPYVEFPDNIADIIGSGLIIKYVITLGAAGNISTQYLTKLLAPLQVDVIGSSTADKVISFERADEDTTDSETDADNLLIYNTGSTINGVDPETIDEAYNSYKKIVGTFDTLVTCRDYANAIYNLFDSQTNYPYVSNVQVADRRTDINYGNNIVTYSTLGKEIIVDTDDTKITPFTLCLYPLNPIYNIYDINSYTKSFKPLNTTNLIYIKRDIEDLKTLSHTYQKLNADDIYCIKNYYRLNIRLVTTYKVNEAEQMDIKNNVRKALFTAFNARRMDYGYEPPFDETLETIIKSADARIKNVDPQDPYIYTKLMLANGNEILLDEKTSSGGVDVRDYYLKILAKNILAGRLPLFKYETDFSYDFGQSQVDTTELPDFVGGPVVPKLKSVTTKLELEQESGSTSFEYTLNDDEIIQCIAPSLQTEITYPAYVNFRWEGDTVEANTEYMLSGADKLLINYTDSNNVVHNLEYGPYYVKDNGKREDRKDGVFFKPNFKMTRTLDAYVVGGRSGLEKIVDGQSMWFSTIATNEQIDIRRLAYRVIDETELYCYWSTTRANNALFTDRDAVHKDPDDLTSDILYYETLLGDNEYFAYCDSDMTDIVIRGSGTKLRWNSQAPLTANDTTWICTEQGIDNLIENGISAFEDFNWQIKSFAIDTLEIHAMQILTLASSDTIHIDGVQFGNKLTNDWTPIPPEASITYKIGEDGTPEPLSSVSIPYLAWQIRTRLDLNCGPSLAQPVKKNQTIIFTDENDNTYEVKSYGTNDSVEPRVALSQLVSLSGGNNIDLTVTKISIDGVSTPSCELSALVTTYTRPTYTTLEGDSGNPQVKTNYFERTGRYCTIPVAKLNYSNNIYSFDLPLVTSSGETTLIMFFTSKQSLTGYTINVETSGNHIREYNSGYGFGPSVLLCVPATETSIKIVEVDSTDEITVKVTRMDGETGECNLVIGDITKSLTRDDSGNTLTLNPRFGLDKSEEDKLLGKLSELDTDDVFYYNNPIDKGSAIDVEDTSSPDFFWDRNNVYNKFTLGEIDFDADNGTVISIANASQL